MSVRDLVGKIPYMAGCKDADRFSERNTILYDLEVADPKSIFSYRKDDETQNRLAVAEIPPEFVEDSKLYRYAMDRVKIAMLSYDKEKGRISPKQQDTLDLLISDHKENPEPIVDEVFNLEASTMGVWNP